MTVLESAELFFTALAADGVRPYTVRWYRWRLQRFLGLYGSREVQTVTVDDVRSYIVHLQSLDYSAHTHFALVRVVRRLFKWLYEERRIDISFHKRIKLPRLPQPVPKAAQMSDVVALLRVCLDTPCGRRDRAIILFFLDTGCRVGGLCSLRRSDLDLENQRVQVMEKGDRARTLLFGDRTTKALRDWLEVRPGTEHDVVFVSMADGKPIIPNTVSQMLRRLKRRSGVDGRVNPHSFRHFFAREYILAGGDLASASELMGHTQIYVTKQFYAVFVAEELREKHRAYSPVGRLPLPDG